MKIILFFEFFLVLFISNFLKIKIICGKLNKIQNFTKERNLIESQNFSTNSESSLLTIELENDLFQLLNKIRQKKIQNRNSQNSNSVSVSIKNFYDLRDYLENIQNMKDNLLKEKDKEKIDLDNLVSRISENIKNNQNNLNKLKDEYDKIIKKTNDVNRDINRKQSELMITKSDFDYTKTEYEKFNEIFLEKVKNNFANAETKNYEETKQNSDLKLEDKILQKFLKLNTKISDLGKSLTERNKLQNLILTIQEKKKKSEIETKNLQKILDENKFDNKFFNSIQNNLHSNIKQMRSEEFNSTVLITSLNKLVNDKDNLKKLEAEKFQLNEMYKETYKNIKKLLGEHEAVQYEVNNLMKTKNKLKEEISAKEIEENLKIVKLKEEISELKKEIKKTEIKMSENLKEQKNFLVSNEVKIKNLLLIFNNLLIKAKRRNENYKNDGFLNELLFDNNIIDVNKEVNESIIQEINNSITEQGDRERIENN